MSADIYFDITWKWLRGVSDPEPFQAFLTPFGITSSDIEGEVEEEATRLLAVDVRATVKVDSDGLRGTGSVFEGDLLVGEFTAVSALAS